jgi:hypothetical protein
MHCNISTYVPGAAALRIQQQARFRRMGKGAHAVNVITNCGVSERAVPTRRRWGVARYGVGARAFAWARRAYDFWSLSYVRGRRAFALPSVRRYRTSIGGNIVGHGTTRFFCVDFIAVARCGR